MAIFYVKLVKIIILVNEEIDSNQFAFSEEQSNLVSELKN